MKNLIKYDDELVQEGKFIAKEIYQEDPGLDLDSLFEETVEQLEESILWPLQKRLKSIREVIKNEVMGPHQ